MALARQRRLPADVLRLAPLLGEVALGQFVSPPAAEVAEDEKVRAVSKSAGRAKKILADGFTV
jgi:hypothetical protein